MHMDLVALLLIGLFFFPLILLVARGAEER